MDTAVRNSRASLGRQAALRAALVGVALSAAVAAWLVAPVAGPALEPELSLLLRGMAAIKGVLALAAAGLVWWRFRYPVGSGTAAAYIVSASLLVFGSVLIWQLAHVAVAAGLFHAGALVCGVVAWQEGRRIPRFAWQPLHAARRLEPGRGSSRRRGTAPSPPIPAATNAVPSTAQL